MRKPLPMFAQVCMLPITPTNRREAYNRLCALEYLDRKSNPSSDSFMIRPMSKRRERLNRMYWAFRKMEEKSNRF